MTARKAIGTIVLVTMALGAGFALGKKPWDVYMQQQQDAREKRQEMLESEANRAKLLQMEAEVRSSVGRERLARKAGFVKPGETPVEE
jgi:hypothetical protein